MENYKETESITNSLIIELNNLIHNLIIISYGHVLSINICKFSQLEYYIIHVCQKWVTAIS